MGDYLARAPVPISSAFPEALAQKALTVSLSLSVRVVMLSLLTSCGGDACQLRRWAFMSGARGHARAQSARYGGERRSRRVGDKVVVEWRWLYSRLKSWFTELRQPEATWGNLCPLSVKTERAESISGTSRKSVTMTASIFLLEVVKLFLFVFFKNKYLCTSYVYPINLKLKSNLIIINLYKLKVVEYWVNPSNYFYTLSAIDDQTCRCALFLFYL